MRILIIGSGGREHALAWKLGQSPEQPELFIAPGNGGTASLGTNIPLEVDDIEGLVDFARREKIDFVVPGPELPLVMGVVDAFKQAGIPCFGPDRFTAQMEGSKSFAKEVMRAAGVPTADFAVFSSYEEAVAFVRKKGAPIVIKADGLAAGKGVVVALTVDEAQEALAAMMRDKVFGEAGSTVVIEDALCGEEVSFIAFCQGEAVVPLPSAQDHKAAYDGDKGPNTGGMGAYSPAPVLPESEYGRMVETVIRPILGELQKRGHPYSGILYAGLMMTDKGPMVIEYNVRFGDPECQPQLMRMEDDLLGILMACEQGRLEEKPFRLKRETALCVVVAAEGYPGSYQKGMAVGGLENAEKVSPDKVKVFHAGTVVQDGKVVSCGGRVLGVTALGNDLAEAQQLAYDAAKRISMEHSRYRKDIGSKGFKK